ncbi:hypothetical protein [Halalkalibacter krulwichiae]|uniref:Uncharacterized protein n=1 Tax=Halalkalibacter krulwichiae TaxID=199441 RepID=A0A1X9MB64_9BACI|nr:hypothetical protein [Halalkalibacter krulwichiae]ARK29884.1 hypothetical protein BkAM31D_08420 [Halalkalibacter krulwichiae]
MDNLTKRLQANVLENPAIEMKETLIWRLPVVPLDVEFKRVKRLKMDILMKMILLAVFEADIRRAANLAELLLVEELFIADLLEKMERTGLIRLEKGIYQRTAKGDEQLKAGIVEEELEDESIDLSYTPDKDEIWFEQEGTFTEGNEEYPLYRYAKATPEFTDKDRLLQVVSECKNELDENGLQIVVADVLQVNQRETYYVPCIEFQLYNKEQDIFYARVWNSLLERWDETLEKQIEEKELMEWRRKWKID